MSVFIFIMRPVLSSCCKLWF